MKTVNSAAMALLAVFAAAPALAQETEVFSGGICEIDTTPLKVPAYKTPDGTRSVFTFNATKQCTGVASTRNVFLTCIGPLPGWTAGDKQVRNFDCTINGDQCGLSPKSTDTKNPPFITTTITTLKVKGGVATLTCQYKP